MSVEKDMASVVLLSKDEIRGNDYNLNIPAMWIPPKQQSWDIYSAVFGGIPARKWISLKPYWDAFPGLKYELFEQNERTNYEN